jgi:K+-sensing histidine kinase KdpD
VLARTQAHLRLSRHQFQLETLVRQRVGELADAHRRLCIWDDAKTQWLNMLSHEMRTPLTGVFAATEILFRNLPPHSPFRDLRADYELSRLRIEKLIDDALTLAQIDISTLQADLKPALLPHLLQRAVTVVSRQVPDISILARYDAVEGVSILGDSQLLNRAFIDLLNTIASCAKEGETLTLDARVHDGMATLELATNGAPLSAEALETFFDIGGQRMLLKQGGDFGLGAALASRIIRLFEGRVSIRNGPERGILVQASLPLGKPAPNRKTKP